MQPNFRHCTTLEVARRLNVDRRTVRRLIAEGAITPAAKLPGQTGAYLFDPEDVDQLVAERGPVGRAS